jgi:predicted Zn-dependent protease
VATEAGTLHDRLTSTELVALMDRAIARLPADCRCHVELARAHLIGRSEGHARLRAELEAIDARYGTPAGDVQWVQYRAHVWQSLDSLPWNLIEAGRLATTGRPAEALALAESIGADQPGYVDALVLRPHCVRVLQRTQEAARILDRAASAKADHPGVWIETAWLRLDQGDTRGAEEAGRRAHVLCAGRGDATEANVLDVLGLALSGSGQHAGAVATLQQAVVCAPRNPSLRIHLAGCLVRAGQPAAAARALRTALALDAHNAEANQLLAELEANG